MSLELRLERDRLAPGEWVKGTVIARVAIPAARSLQVLVGLYETTRDYREAFLETTTGPLHVGPVPAGLALPFAVQLPANAPPPYESRWGSLSWDVDAKADIAHGQDAHAVVPLTVVPQGIGEDQLRGPGAGTPVWARGGFPGRGGAGIPGLDLGGFGGGGLAGAAASALGIGSGGAPGGDPTPGPSASAGPGASAAPGSFPAAWYADPWLEKRLRYWDGQRWTSHLAD